MALSTLPPEQQQALVAAVRRGSPDAFTHIYDALHGRIYNLAARIVGDREDAADITQEVFLTAYRRLPGHDGEMRLEPWLYKVTVNACYDHLRRRARRPADALTDADALPAGIDEVERARLSAAVCDTLDQMTPRYRTALVLKDLHGCDNGEVAEIMGLTAGTAGVLLFRARKSFQQAFRKLAHGSPLNVAAVGLGAFLPELPVPAGLSTPPAFLSAAPAALIDHSAASFDAGTLATDAAPSAAGGDATTAQLLGDTAAPLLSDPAGPLAALAPVAAAPLTASATSGAAAKVGSAVLVKVVLAVVGVTALAGGGVTVSSLGSSPPVADGRQPVAAASTGANGGRAEALATRPTTRDGFMRSTAGEPLLRRAGNGGSGSGEGPAVRSRDGGANGTGSGSGGGDGRSSGGASAGGSGSGGGSGAGAVSASGGGGGSGGGGSRSPAEDGGASTGGGTASGAGGGSSESVTGSGPGGGQAGSGDGAGGDSQRSDGAAGDGL